MSLLQDIEILIITTKDQFARSPLEVQVQTRLKALLDLQTVLKTQQVPHNMLQAAREQINQIQNAPLPSLPPTPQVQQAVATPIPLQPPYQPLASTLPIPSATSLADLLASAAKSRQTLVPTPTNPAVHAAQYHNNGTHAPSIPVTSALSAENPLIASLRAAGMLLPAGSTPTNGSFVAPQAPSLYVPRPPPQVDTPPVQLAHLVRPPLAETCNDAQLTSGSLKMWATLPRFVISVS